MEAGGPATHWGPLRGFDLKSLPHALLSSLRPLRCQTILVLLGSVWMLPVPCPPNPQPLTSLGTGSLRGGWEFLLAMSCPHSAWVETVKLSNVSTDVLKSAALYMQLLPPLNPGVDVVIKIYVRVMLRYSLLVLLRLVFKLKVALSLTFCDKRPFSSLYSPSSWTSVFSVFPTICFGFQVTLASVLRRAAFAGCGDCLLPWG